MVGEAWKGGSWPLYIPVTPFKVRWYAHDTWFYRLSADALLERFYLWMVALSQNGNIAAHHPVLKNCLVFEYESSLTLITSSSYKYSPFYCNCVALKREVHILTCVFSTLKWLALTPMTHSVQFYLRAATYFSPEAKISMWHWGWGCY